MVRFRARYRPARRSTKGAIKMSPNNNANNDTDKNPNKPIEPIKEWFSPRHGNISALGIKVDARSTRLAKCCYGDTISESSPKLPMFKAKPNCEYDEYYCGCFGWD